MIQTDTAMRAVQEFLEAIARHDIDAAIAAADPQVQVTVHPLGVRAAGADTLRQVLADLVGGFPDLMINVSRVVSTGDVVTVLARAEGTQAASYAGAINLEKRLDIDQAWRFVVADGLIIEVTAYWCQAQLYRRLAVKRYDEIAIVLAARRPT